MSDKRQRARVQGSWARQQPGPGGHARKHPEPTTVSTASWGISSQKTPETFEFQPPTKVTLQDIYVWMALLSLPLNLQGCFGGSAHTFSFVLHQSPSEMFHQLRSSSESALLSSNSWACRLLLTELVFLSAEKKVNMRSVTGHPACPGESFCFKLSWILTKFEDVQIKIWACDWIKPPLDGAIWRVCMLKSPD